MERIKSTNNPEIKALAKLSSAKERSRQNRFIVEGTRSIETFIDAGHVPQHVYITKPLSESLQEKVALKKIVEVSDHVMAKIAQTKTPSGFLATFAIPSSPEPSTLASGLVLTQISNPGNMGTLIRTSVALGKKTVVVIDGTDPWSPKVIQASAGTIASVSIFKWSWKQLLDNKNNLKLYALTVSGGDAPKAIDTHNALLIIGNEAHGIPSELQDQCDGNITLQMPGNTESLNAAVAGSIISYLVWQP